MNMDMSYQVEEQAEYCRAVTTGRAEALEEEDLFERIVHCYSNELKRFARYRCGAGPDWEDVYQDTMVAVVRYLTGFRGDTKVRAWLFKITSSACTKMRRGMKNRKDLHVPAEEEEGQALSSPEPNAELQVSVEENLECLSDCLNTLQPEDREILLMHESNDMSLRAISAETGHSVSAIKSKLFRARRKLQEELQKKGFEQ